MRCERTWEEARSARAWRAGAHQSMLARAREEAQRLLALDPPAGSRDARRLGHLLDLLDQVEEQARRGPWDGREEGNGG